MSTPSFWSVTAPSEDSDAWVEPQRRGVDKAVERIRDGKRLKRPLVLTAHHPGRAGDLLFTGGLAYIVASQRLLDVLTDLGTTGWTSAPLTVEGLSGDYWLLVVTGVCADFRIEGGDDYEDYAEIPVDASIGWDGSDVFYREDRAKPGVAEPSSEFIVTDKVRRAFDDAGIRVKYEPPITSVG